MDDYELFDIPYQIDDLQAWEEEREDVRLEQGDEQVPWALFVSAPPAFQRTQEGIDEPTPTRHLVYHLAIPSFELLP